MNHRLLLGYYAATAVFLLLDVVFDVNLRVAFLDDYPAWRGAYYALCGICFLLVLKKPDWETVVGGIESLFTLIALILSFALRTVIPVELSAGESFRPVTVEQVINFLLSGFVAYYVWQRGLSALRHSS